MTNLQTLQESLPKLSSNDRSFALSMMATIEKTKRVSDKQAFWIAKLVERATNPEAAAPQKSEVGDLAGVLNLFETAKKHLKFPAIVLSVPDVGEIRLNVAGDKAKVPGSINVASNEPFGDRTWYGRIRTNGVFEHSPREAAPAAVVEKLRQFAADPAKVAGEHGQLTGKCCFCNTKLTDERSTGVGYGPVCAKNFGLAWGARPTTFGAAVGEKSEPLTISYGSTIIHKQEAA